MKKIIRLTERDLTRIVRRVIRENEGDIEEPYYTKSYGDPLEFYKNGMMQFALSVNLDDVPEVEWLRRKLDALTKEAEGKLSEEELRKLISHRNKEIEPYMRGEEEDFSSLQNIEEDDDNEDDETNVIYGDDEEELKKSLEKELANVDLTSYSEEEALKLFKKLFKKYKNHKTY